MAIDVRRARPDDLAAIAALATALQARPDRHVAYLSTEAAAIATDLRDLDGWTSVSAVAEREIQGDPSLLGWLVGEVDSELGRVWWWGPQVADAPRADEPWTDTASALYDHARALLPDGVDQEEFAIDDRFGQLRTWAVDRHFSVDPASAILTRPLDDQGSPLPDPAPDIELRPARPHDATALGPLHDALFPDTHTTGSRLFASEDERLLRLVAEIDGLPIGYVAIEHNAEHELYIDFLGVDPEHRRRGLGRALVTAAMAEGRRQGADRAALTVRTANDGARALYRSIGFTEERVLQPLRRGFRLP